VTRGDGAPLTLSEREVLEATIGAAGLEERGAQAHVDALPGLAAARSAPPAPQVVPKRWSWRWLRLGRDPRRARPTPLNVRRRLSPTAGAAKAMLTLPPFR